MDCELGGVDALATTGGPILAWSLIASALLLMGIAVTILGRRRRAIRGSLAVLVVLCSVLGLALASRSASYADTDSCLANTGVGGPGFGPQPTPLPTVAPGQVTVRQTSVNTGIAPDAAPSPITGEVTNNSLVDVLITSVTVSISGVTKAPDAALGSCSAADYILTETVMPVNVIIPANGGSTPFSGASISFNNTSENQDACQRATVHLLYTAV
ncbi:hypothetical protein SAMN05892883_3093 [Jatrophihabitans sp. GAS493]|uniref:hypothetical protein n=1 Tax=Jatrophihabitans sp. GAS493 TaxID=1907575 RepID=UPI000BB6B2A7|nr:hypothetical protein [Jatrophihabitans sp. GAS493]SOD73899.1 hypothetical protein SAMN05892883_3093 [Jatrophihabitans sp. GAS493]